MMEVSKYGCNQKIPGLENKSKNKLVKLYGISFSRLSSHDWGTLWSLSTSEKFLGFLSVCVQGSTTVVFLIFLVAPFHFFFLLKSIPGTLSGIDLFHGVTQSLAKPPIWSHFHKLFTVITTSFSARMATVTNKMMCFFNYFHSFLETRFTARCAYSFSTTWGANTATSTVTGGTSLLELGHYSTPTAALFSVHSWRRPRCNWPHLGFTSGSSHARST